MYHSTTQISTKGIEAGPDMTNRKPYRTKAQKAEAKRTATKRSDGTFRSPAPVSCHKEKKPS